MGWPRVVGTYELAELLGVTPEWIRRLAQRGMPKAKDEGRANKNCFVLKEALRWYIEHMSGNNSIIDITAEKARLTSAQATKAEIEVRTLRGILVARDEMLDSLGEILSALRAELLGLPGRLANELSVAESVAEVKQILDRDLRRSLNNAADKLEALQEESKARQAEIDKPPESSDAEDTE